jgi:hypothetical protein
MAKNKSKKVEKETRRLMEGITDLVKKKGDRYKFKSKNKKMIKKVKKTCVHWIIRKGKEVPTVMHDPEHPGNWKCTICGASFPIKPVSPQEYRDATETMLAYANQMQFWGVKLGGDAEDTKMFIRLKENLPRFNKVSKQIIKRVNQRQAWESNREKSDMLSQFDAYAPFQYKG